MYIYMKLGQIQLKVENVKKHTFYHSLVNELTEIVAAHLLSDSH